MPPKLTSSGYTPGVLGTPDSRMCLNLMFPKRYRERDNVDIRQIVLPEGYYVLSGNFWRTAALGGGLFFTAYTFGIQSVAYYCSAILYPDNTVVLDGASSSGIMRHVSLPFENGYLFGGSDNEGAQYVYGRYTSNYLGTIANLATPVVKNASQTLKVTYTLTDA